MVKENGKTMADAEGDVLRGLRKFIKENIYIYNANYIYHSHAFRSRQMPKHRYTQTHAQTITMTILVRPPSNRSHVGTVDHAR